MVNNYTQSCTTVSDREIEPATSYYVSNDGDDARSCDTTETSCKTFGYAGHVGM